MHRVLAICIACLLAPGALAAEPAKPKDAAKPPAPERLQAWADHIAYQGQTGTFTFTGKVTVIC